MPGHGRSGSPPQLKCYPADPITFMTGGLPALDSTARTAAGTFMSAERGTTTLEPTERAETGRDAIAPADAGEASEPPFCRRVVHELNNLLTSVVGNAELCHETLPEDSPEKEQVWLILDAGRRAARLVASERKRAAAAQPPPRAADDAGPR